MIGVNFIPQGVQRRRLARRRMKAWAVCAAASVTALSLPIGLEWLNRAEADELRQAGMGVQQELARVQAELKAMRDEAEHLMVQIQRADALRSKRAWSGMMALIAEAMPPACWLTQLATDPPSPAGGSPDRRHVDGGENDAAVVTIEAPRTLRLGGYARAASEPLDLVTRLKRTGVFTQVRLERSQRESGGRSADGDEADRFRFEVVCQW